MSMRILGKIVLSGIMAAGVMFTCAGYASAFEAEHLKFGVFGAGAFPSDEDLETTAYVGGRLTYEFTPNLELGVESGYHEYKDEASGIHFGDITGIPLLAVGLIKFPIEASEGKFIPYVTGGAGVVLWDYKESSLTSASGIALGNDTSFSAKAGAGLEYRLTDNFTLFSEGSYMWSDYNVDLSLTGATVASSEVKMDTVFVGGGIKLNF